MEEHKHYPPLTEGTLLILLSLLTPRHGYGVMQHIETLTGGRVTMGAGTLYGAINSLIEKRWIRATAEEAGTRKKVYTTTDTGRQMIQVELMRLGELLTIGMNEIGQNMGGENNAN